MLTFQADIYVYLSHAEFDWSNGESACRLTGRVVLASVEHGVGDHRAEEERHATGQALKACKGASIGTREHRYPDYRERERESHASLKYTHFHSYLYMIVKCEVVVVCYCVDR